MSKLDIMCKTMYQRVYQLLIHMIGWDINIFTQLVANTASGFDNHLYNQNCRRM